jgi:hypothetical protein
VVWHAFPPLAKSVRLKGEGCLSKNDHLNTPWGSMKSVADAQESLRVQFNEHKCEQEDAFAPQLPHQTQRSDKKGMNSAENSRSGLFGGG